MQNWGSSAYAIEGDAKEIKSLYELMKGLKEREKPSIENGFGTTWLGCLVDALGKDWNTVHCRGSWSQLELDGGVLRFFTETAWSPCNETFDLVCEKFPSLKYYFQAEEPGMGIYETNDEDGTYFPDRYFLDVCTLDEEYLNEYFETEEDVFEWLEDEFGKPIRTREDVMALDKEWRDQCDYAFCNLYEFEIVS